MTPFVQLGVGCDEFRRDPGAASLGTGCGARLHHLLECFINRDLEGFLPDDFGQAFRDMKIVQLDDATRIRRPPGDD